MPNRRPLAGGPDLNEMDFDQIAEAQGWNADTLVTLLRQYISHQHADDALDDFARRQAEDENANAVDIPDVTFNNVTITIAGAKTPADAYDLLCGALGRIENTTGVSVEWQTDTYHTSGDENPDPTSDLFPTDGSTRERKGRA